MKKHTLLLQLEEERKIHSFWCCLLNVKYVQAVTETKSILPKVLKNVSLIFLEDSFLNFFSKHFSNIFSKTFLFKNIPQTFPKELSTRINCDAPSINVLYQLVHTTKNTRLNRHQTKISHPRDMAI